jgi:hypothetical protein
MIPIDLDRRLGLYFAGVVLALSESYQETGTAYLDLLRRANLAFWYLRLFFLLLFLFSQLLSTDRNLGFGKAYLDLSGITRLFIVHRS